MENISLEYLEHIIELEKDCFVQEKLINSIEGKIEKLGVPKTINPPQKIHTYVPPVEYNVITPSDTFDSEQITQLVYCGTIIMAIIGGIIGNASNAIWSGIIVGGIIGAIIGASIGFGKNSSNRTDAKLHNERAQREAQEKADRLIKEQDAIDERNYQIELKKYQALKTFEKNRVMLESEKKNELIYSKKELLNKHQETKKVLEQFYDFADIYETYRNIVAICHIYEYLKSGICNQLTGRDGAYMVFKYEMYEKLKIERLDAIVSKLDQLHFDNITLNSTMQTISDKCSNIIKEVSDMKIAQMEANERNEAMMKNIGNKMDDVINSMSYQNAVIAYNQECTTNELKQIKWLSAFERR